MNEYEAAIVGRVLTDPDTLHSIRVRPDHFADPFLREVYRVALSVDASGAEVNMLTVSDASDLIKARPQELAEVTSAAALGRLDVYESKVIESYRRRELAALGRELVDMSEDPVEALGWIDTRVEEITAETETDRIYSADELVKPTLEWIEARYKAQGTLPGIVSGFESLDALTFGFQPRKLYYIGARPSQGKSALMMNMALNITGSHKVGYISVESSKEELMLRTFANAGSVDAGALSTGYLKGTQFADVNKAAERLSKAPLYFYDVPNIPIDRVAAVARMMSRRHGVEVIFVDYLQIIDAGAKADPKHVKVAVASMRLKALARELEVPVVAGVQLRRDAENRRPTLADFSDSSQIEKDADVAILLHHEDTTEFVPKVWALVAKHRDGPKGDIPLRFQGRYVRFIEAQSDVEPF